MPATEQRRLPPPTVWTTPAEYQRRSCNRCGDCCEAFWLPSVFELTDALLWAFHDCRRGELQHGLFRLNRNRTGVLRTDPPQPGTFTMTACDPDRVEEHARMRRQAHWLLDLEPLPAGGLPHELYRCTRFERDATGAGRCTDYENRAPACVMYPMTHPRYFAPASASYPRCSWYVNLISVVVTDEQGCRSVRSPSFVDEAPAQMAG